MSKYNFYLSYSAADGKDIARLLRNSLVEKGYSVFWAEELAAGVTYADAICEAIVNSDYFIPIITEKATENYYVRREIQFAIEVAQRRATTVIPIMVTENLSYGLQLLLSSTEKLTLNQSIELSVEVADIADWIDAFVGDDFKTSLLYEKLSEYQSLNSHNKKAETVCELIKAARERYTSQLSLLLPKAWKLCEELLSLYGQLTEYKGRYDEESRKVCDRIITELDRTSDILVTPSANSKESLFRRHILFACVAIRLIYMDGQIRRECNAVLSGGKNKGRFSLKEHIVKQVPFIDVYNAGIKEGAPDSYEDDKKAFIKETTEYFLFAKIPGFKGLVFETDVYNTLINHGYDAEQQLSTKNHLADITINKNGKPVLFIDCVNYVKAPPRTSSLKKNLEDEIKALGGILHTVNKADWEASPQAELEKIKELYASFDTEDDKALVTIARFIQDGNKLFDALQKNGMAAEFSECLRESYERLKNYCTIVGADDIAAQCAERIVELRNEIEKQENESSANEKAEEGIKSLLGFTLKDSGEYDVFISFKSEDQDLAEKVYDYCNRHIKVPFWSKKTLPKLSESEYGKAIDRALESSKHFVVVLSDLKYLDAQWVAYEMDVFNTEIKEGRKKGSNFVMVATDDVYDEIIKSNKTVLPITYRRYQIIKMSEYEETLAQYIS